VVPEEEASVKPLAPWLRHPWMDCSLPDAPMLLLLCED
jgi:hypothetical protein